MIHGQDKGLRIVDLDTNSYIEKLEHKITRSLFDKRDTDPNPKFKFK